MNIEKLSQRAAALTADMDWIRLKDGITTVRVVGRPGDEEPYRETWRHFLQDYVAAEDFPRAPICMNDESCPGCRKANELREMGDELAANKAKPQHRFVWVAISRDNPYDAQGNVCLKLVEVPFTAFVAMVEVAKDWERDFTDPKEGYDLEIRRSSATGVTKYEVRAVTKREGATQTIVISPLTDEEIALVNDSFPDLDSLMTPPDYARYAAALGYAVQEPQVTQSESAGAPPAQQPRTYDTQAEGTGAAQRGQSPVNPTPSSNPPSNPSNTAPVCPYFAREYDPNNDACAECSDAEACKTGTEAARVQRVPERRPT